MIFYRPTDGEVLGTQVGWRPRTCFVMAAMGGDLPRELLNAKRRLKAALKRTRFGVVDAASETTGKDFLLKIWSLAVACPVGVVQA